jgi:hypothetical protein
MTATERARELIALDSGGYGWFCQADHIIELCTALLSAEAKVKILEGQFELAQGALELAKSPEWWVELAAAEAEENAAIRTSNRNLEAKVAALAELVREVMPKLAVYNGLDCDIAQQLARIMGAEETE